MAVYIRYEDIRTVIDESSRRFSQWQEILTQCQDKMKKLTDMEHFSGETADSIRCYFDEVHGTLIQMINSVFMDFSGKFILYRDGYYEIDGNKNTVIKENVLDEGMNKYKNLKNGFEDLASNIIDTINSISDIASIPRPDGSSAVSRMKNIRTKMDELIQEVTDYESSTASREAQDSADLVRSVTALIKDYGSGGSVAATDYTSGDYLKSSAFMDAAVAINGSQEYLSENMDKIEAAYEDEARVREEIQKEYEEELAKERAKAGIWQAVGGACLAVVGVAAIVASAGAASPIVAGIALTSGIGTCAFAGAEMYEGGENLKYGLNGDVTTQAWNPLRDTVFCGNQQVYNITKEVFSTTAGLSVTAIKAGNVAVAMRRSQFYGSGIKGACSREVLKKVALKEGAKSAAKEFAKDKATDMVSDFVTDPLVDRLGDEIGMSETGKEIIKTAVDKVVDKGTDKITGDTFGMPEGYENYKNKRGVKKIDKQFESYDQAKEIKGYTNDINDLIYFEQKADADDEHSAGNAQVEKAEDAKDDYKTWRQQQIFLATE